MKRLFGSLKMKCMYIFNSKDLTYCMGEEHRVGNIEIEEKGRCGYGGKIKKGN